MKTVQVKVYKFDELSDEAKERVIDSFRHVNVEFDWWEGIYSDAENVGIKITSFDLDRNRHADGVFQDNFEEICRRIMAEHGEVCETYKTAQSYLNRYNELVTKYSDGVNTELVAEDNEWEFDKECEELREEFEKEIFEDYSMMLQNEYEYLCSDEAVYEFIRSNEYEFTEDGELF
jgi:hypothetical protein